MRKIIAFVEDDTADGGLGMVFRSLAENMTEYFKIIYVSTRENEGRVSERIDYVRFKENGEFVPHTNGLKRSLSGVTKLHSILKDKNVDVAVSFGFYSNVRLSLASFGLKTKVVISERGNAARFQGLNRILLDLIFLPVDKIIFQTEAAKRAYPGLLSKKGEVIYNAIFKEKSLPDCSGMQWDNRIVSVGRIHPDKNFPLLVKAFAKLKDEFPELTLEIFGEEEPGSKEPYLEQLKSLSMNLGIADRVTFMGQTSDVGKAISGARAFVLSSVLEGMPNALIEAMACGLPCVTTDFLPGCAREIVTDDIDGVVSARDDVDELAKDIAKVLRAPEKSRKMAKNALKIRQRLSKKVIFDQWRQMFCSINTER